MFIEKVKTLERLFREMGTQLLRQGKKENSNNREARNTDIYKFHGMQYECTSKSQKEEMGREPILSRSQIKDNRD